MNRTLLLKLTAAAAAALFAVSCARQPVYYPPVQPEGYVRLLEIYVSGEEFVSFEQKDVTTTLTFENSTLSLRNDVLPVHDCTQTGHPPVCLNDEQTSWLVNGIDQKIGNHSTLEDAKAQPVYLYVDSESLHMFISNRHLLHFVKHIDTGYRKPKKYTMPVVKITFDGTTVHKDTYSSGTITIDDPDKFYSDVAHFECKMQIKGRGNSTWDMPKKPYRIKMESKNEVLGMPAAKNWAFLANYADKSLMRNNTAMEISRILEFPWTPRSHDVELYLNGKYQGVYSLFEHKETGKNKVNIADDEYYLEIDETLGEDYWFWTGKGVPIVFQNPEEPSSQQLEYLKKYMQDFESALFGSSFGDSDKGYSAYIDVDSFVDNYIIEELAKDIDGNLRRSTFLTLCSGKKLTFYHVWDFDLSFGNADYFPGGENGPTGWWIKNHGSNSSLNCGWYWRLFQDRGFVSKVKERWNEVYPKLQLIPNFIDMSVAEMGDAPARNFQTWQILNTYVWPNVKVTGSYPKEVQYLKEFYNERLQWLNENINKL